MDSTHVTDPTTPHTKQTDISIITLNIRGLNTTNSLEKKLPKIKLLIDKKQPDFLLLQETNITKKEIENEIIEYLGAKTSIFNNKATGSGNAILQFSDGWKIIGHDFKEQGRKTVVEVTKNNKKYNLINIYAPSDAKERKIMFTKLNKEISKLNDKIILAGDYNVTLDDRDIVGLNVHKNPPGRI